MSTAGMDSLDALKCWREKVSQHLSQDTWAVGLIPFGGQAGGKPLVEHCCFIGHTT